MRNRYPCALLIGCNHYGHSMKIPQEIKNSVTTWFSNLTSGYLFKRMDRSPRICKILMKYLHTHVHNSTIHNSQEVEAMHMPTEWMSGLTQWNKYINGILLSLKGILTHAMTWTNLEDIMLSEISQSQKDKYCMIPLVWRTKSCHSEKEKVLIERWLPEAGSEGW